MVEPDKQAKKDTKWRKGQSGNPAGRPVGKLSLTTQLKKFLEANPDRVLNVVQALYRAALTGNIQALQEIFNRIDGKVTERHELEAKVPVTLVFQPVIEPKQLPEANVIDSEAIEIHDTV